MHPGIVDGRWVALRWRLAGHQAAVAFRRFALAYERRDDPDQLRVPAGEPGAGPWSEGDGDGDQNEFEAEKWDDSEHADARIGLAGGFTEQQRDLTVQQFMSQYCLGSVKNVIGDELLDLTIRNVQQLKSGGNVAATRCIKILGQDRFRK